MAQHDAQRTTDHEKIRRWAESRGGKPASVAATAKGHDPGILRIDFNEPEEGLERISWEEFFDKFEESGLSFLYQDKTASGETSRFFKVIRRSDGDAEG